MCVCARACVRVHACVCVCERERERESLCVCVCGVVWCVSVYSVSMSSFACASTIRLTGSVAELNEHISRTPV